MAHQTRAISGAIDAASRSDLIGMAGIVQEAGAKNRQSPSRSYLRSAQYGSLGPTSQNGRVGARTLRFLW